MTTCDHFATKISTVVGDLLATKAKEMGQTMVSGQLEIDDRRPPRGPNELSPSPVLIDREIRTSGLKPFSRQTNHLKCIFVAT